MADVSNVRALRLPPANRPPGLRGCVWSTRRDPATARVQLRGHDAVTGALRIVWELKFAPVSDNTIAAGTEWAVVGNGVDEGALALMLAAEEGQ